MVGRKEFDEEAAGKQKKGEGLVHMIRCSNHRFHCVIRMAAQKTVIFSELP